MSGSNTFQDIVCRRCDQPFYRHMYVVGTGRVCPVAVLTFEPKPGEGLAFAEAMKEAQEAEKRHEEMFRR